MELQHLEVKLPAAPAADFDAGALIPVFQDWVRAQSCPELLVDVADYRHVPGGPGVLLVGHEADYALDEAPPGPGLLYRRKAALDGANADRLAQALGAAARAAARLAADPALEGRLAFAADGLQVTVNDRLLAPNTPATAAALVPELEAWFAATLGHERFSLVWDSEPRHRFAVTLACVEPLALDALLARVPD